MRVKLNITQWLLLTTLRKFYSIKNLLSKDLRPMTQQGLPFTKCSVLNVSGRISLHRNEKTATKRNG